MKKLTKAQRHILYIIMLCDFEDSHLSYYCSDGFCFYLFNVWNFADENNSYSRILNEKQLPELWRRKPYRLYSFAGLWFAANSYSNGLEIRKKILNECIEETY